MEVAFYLHLAVSQVSPMVERQAGRVNPARGALSIANEFVPTQSGGAARRLATDVAPTQTA
ncbi:hypothetical protein thsps21_03460 [Pseudomonas sp. No.21]|nr:hypothetical protein TUM20249_46630 [Pseudomonas tohonis]